MKTEKRYLYLDSFEHQLVVAGMNIFRNRLIHTGKPTEDVDALLLKLLKTKIKRFPAETHRSGAQRAPRRKTKGD